jgi:hypothetical protein
MESKEQDADFLYENKPMPGSHIQGASLRVTDNARQMGLLYNCSDHKEM